MSSTTASQTIEDVIEQMDLVIARCIKEKSKIGYFAVLYRDVTVQVSKMIKNKEFENNERMERLDVVFANRFLEAVDQYWKNDKPSKSWLVAFENSKLNSPIILQHLLLGMNAHINLDLAIATAQVAPGALLPQIKNDFQKIMQLLSNMIDGVQARIEEVSPFIKLIDRLGDRTDEMIAGFAVNKARDLAWITAEKLAVETPEQFNKSYEFHDDIVSLLANVITKPGIIARTCFWIIRLRESKDVIKVIDALQMQNRI